MGWVLFHDNTVLLCGEDDDLTLIDGVGVHQTVGVALINGLVLHDIDIVGLGDGAQSIALLDDVEGFALVGNGGGNEGIVAQLL